MLQLPNYFLTDLPPEAEISPAMIQEAATTLKRNRERYLLPRSSGSLIAFLAELGREWMNPENAFRRMALEMSPAQTGFTPEILGAGLDRFFARFTADNILGWMEQEFGQEDRLDEFSASPAERNSGRSALVFGPVFQVHFTAGNLPCPAFTSILSGVLLRSAQFVKCASRAAPLPRLLAHSIYEMDHKLGACLELASWKGGHEALESVLFQESDCVTATGSDETIAAIRRRVPPGARFVGYGQRVSFGFISHRALAGAGGARLAAQAAKDVIAWDQLGCLSPHVLYVENGSGQTAERFAEQLAAELMRREQAEPRAAASTAVAAAIATRRSFYEVRAAHSPDTRHWFSPKSTAWTVIYEADARFQFSCLHRFIYVKGVASLEEALRGADAVRGAVSTVGLAAAADQAKGMATVIARWGAPRICPLGQMQDPPLAWRHDGRPALADLIGWSDWET